VPDDKVSVHGGMLSEKIRFLMLKGSMLPVTMAEVTKAGFGFSSVIFRIYRIKLGLKFMVPIFLQEHPSGIKSNTGYFAIYQKTGKANP
jgi:hypothetical protein